MFYALSDHYLSGWGPASFLSDHVWLVLVRIPVEIGIHLCICQETSDCGGLLTWKWSSQSWGNWSLLQLNYASSQNLFGSTGENHIVFNYLAVSLRDFYKCIPVTADHFLSVSLSAIHLHCSLYKIWPPWPMDQWCWKIRWISLCVILLLGWCRDPSMLKPLTHIGFTEYFGLISATIMMSKQCYSASRTSSYILFVSVSVLVYNIINESLVGLPALMFTTSV